MVGSRAAMRVLVSNHDTGRPLGADVRISLAPAKAAAGPAPKRLLFSGVTTSLGTLDASFAVPRVKAGAYRMTVDVGSAAGDDLFSQEVTLEESADILLTTDKPLYQPGQTIHLRVLALQKPSRLPFRGQTITFEAEDAKGNKVFRKALETDRFGVASADFVLGTEVNTGLYTLRAANPAAAVERKVTVDRYVLPKFKVVVKSDRPYYRPGDRVEGSIQADYFFGKPVASGKVTIKVSTIDVGVTEIGRVEGTTDAKGGYAFEYALPDAFVGRPLDRGKATVQLEAAVVDGADHQEKGRVSIPVVRDLLDVVAIPASRSLVPGVPNTIYIAVAYPDGTPAAASVDVQGATEAGGGGALRTDELGIATLTFTPREEKVHLVVKARDDRGNDGSATVDLAATGPKGDGVLLAVSNAVATVGETLTLRVLSPAAGGAVYLDVVRDRQTVVTRALDLVDGRGSVTLALTPDLSGTIQIHAYRILPDENIVRDTRTIYVRRADELNVGIAPARGTYRPGEAAEVDFTVTDPAGRPVAALLGVAGVDESVFALSELQPGLEKIYFTLERELMEPKYEVHGLEAAAIVREGPLPVPPRGVEDAATARRREGLRDEAARVVFAAAPVMGDFTIRANTWQRRFELAKAGWLTEMSKDHDTIRQGLERWRRRHVNPLPAGEEDRLVDEKFLPPSALRDPWGRAYRIDRRAGDDFWFTLKSAGPDGRFGTSDDLDLNPALRMRRDDVLMEGVAGRMMALDAAMPAPPRAQLKAMATNEPRSAASPAAKKDAGGGAIRVRQFFPETLYWNPSVITDGSGRARVTIPLADSITTWRLTALAGDADGRLGSAQAPLRVFQDFFADLDLPVALTRGDEIAIPVALYNYLAEPQTVTLSLEPGDWFTSLPGEGPASRGEGRAEVRLGANEVSGVVLPIRVEKIGRHTLTITARGTRLGDAVRKEIDVLPEGREFRDTINDRLDAAVVKEATIPAAAIAGASSLFVKIYPGVFSQAVEGLEALLRMPNGCFEQTSSTTYPNVLVLSYLKGTKQAKPELQMKADQYINVGYQRLVTFEVEGGGFSWFGQAPAHQVLTAYGLLEFSDMSKVHDVDPALIERTQAWLAGRQKPDGTWQQDRGGIAEGIINRQSDVLKTTAYVAWALADSGYQGPEVERALAYLRGQVASADDAYTMALIANAFAARDGRSGDARTAAERLASMKIEKDGGVMWGTKSATFTGAAEGSADLETTGLAAYALLRAGVQPETARRALTYLIRSKDSFGTWRTTQATVWALRALLLALSGGTTDTDATVGVVCNGVEAASIHVTPADSDLMRQVDCGASVKEGRNEIRLSFQGKGNLLYQIVSRYYVPWAMIPPPPKPILGIDVDYDRTTLAKDEMVTERVRVTNNTPQAATNVIVDLAVPPGFELQGEDLAALVGKGIARFEPAARQIIIYVDRVEPGAPLSFSFRLKATMMVKAVNGESAVYPYYNPEKRDAARPVVFRTARRG
jgi:uncharacterized protein YfaS (alpha-2-macroglobulin family)